MYSLKYCAGGSASPNPSVSPPPSLSLPRSQPRWPERLSASPAGPTLFRICPMDLPSSSSKFHIGLGLSFIHSFIPWALVMPSPGNAVLAGAAGSVPQRTLWILTFPAAASAGLHPPIGHRVTGCFLTKLLPGSTPFSLLVPSPEPQVRLEPKRDPGGFGTRCGRLQGWRESHPDRNGAVSWRPLVAPRSTPQWHFLPGQEGPP